MIRDWVSSILFLYWNFLSDAAGYLLLIFDLIDEVSTILYSVTQETDPCRLNQWIPMSTDCELSSALGGQGVSSSVIREKWGDEGFIPSVPFLFWRLQLLWSSSRSQGFTDPSPHSFRKLGLPPGYHANPCGFPTPWLLLCKWFLFKTHLKLATLCVYNLFPAKTLNERVSK